MQEHAIEKELKFSAQKQDQRNVKWDPLSSGWSYLNGFPEQKADFVRLD